MQENRQCTRCLDIKESTQFVVKNGKVTPCCKDCSNAWKKAYYQRNKSKVKAAVKTWELGNRERRRKTKRAYLKRRYKSDALFKLKMNLRTLIGRAMTERGFAKNSKTEVLLGGDFKSVQAHLIATAIKNYGKYFPKRSYHIDHIIPCASATDEASLIALQHFTNLQLLTSQDNLQKGSRYALPLEPTAHLTSALAYLKDNQ